MTATKKYENKFDYKVTVIVPNFNMGSFLPKCIESLLNQTISHEKMEILLIDDGSTDNSIEIMQKYANNHSCIKVFSKQNEGVSKTRNYGIKRAKGKYIFYLDADDMLSPETLEKVSAFFDKHYEEIDLATYRESRIKNEQKLPSHYRFKRLKNSGVYDLTLIENVFASQTIMNICVKNELENNVLFDENMKYHEDQKYCTTILQIKMKLGFCNAGEYFYMRQPNSVVSSSFYAYYLFEPTMNFWEEEFQRYDGQSVPYYIQALYINDLSWKIKSDCLLPYHYNSEQLDVAKSRIIHLLDKIDDEIILLHPAINNYHKHYFINLKTNNDLSTLKGANGLFITNHNKVILDQKKFTIEIRNIKIYDNHIKIIGFIKSPLFNYLKKPTLYLIKNENDLSPEIIDTRPSSWNYYLSKNITNHFELMNITINTSNLKSFEFKIGVGDMIFNCTYKFAPRLIFDHKYKVYSHYRKDKEYYLDGNVFRIKKIKQQTYKKQLNNIRKEYRKSHKKIWLIRNLSTRKLNAFENVWLYYDCNGVDCDNGYYQFTHDFEKRDGVSRYYVINEPNFKEIVSKFPRKQRRHIIKFGSTFHKFLYLKARKIITAFIELNNYFPFNNKGFQKYYTPVCNQKEIIYLQHGILHAHMPWKYSLDRLGIDREVISTSYEYNNLKTNYCFTDEALIPCGMPRYDFIDQNEKPVNRILWAPSWRKYLINSTDSGFEASEEKFLQSRFYKETMQLLNSPALQQTLEKYDFYLDFKLHPIFQCYKHLYTINNTRVTLAANHVSEMQYNIFMTDFSSFVFDFVYLKRPIVYFVPDIEFFKAGMNAYRKLDIPFEDAFGDFVCNSEEAIKAIESILSNQCIPNEKYLDKMNNFFYYKDSQQRERLYQELVNDSWMIPTPD